MNGLPEHKRVKKGQNPKKPINGKKISKYEQRRLKLFDFDKSEVKYEHFGMFCDMTYPFVYISITFHSTVDDVPVHKRTL